jgi:CelD/BcsL family acetyltransferase involved in cellulose biosynthesis
VTVRELDDRAWLAFVEAAPDATVFHHPTWTRAIASTYGYRAFVVTVPSRGARDIDAGISVIETVSPMRHRRWVALPFTDVCAPLAGDESSRAALARELDHLRSAAGVAELEVRAPLAHPHAHPRTAGVLHRLSLSGGTAAVRRGFRQSQVLRNIARAEREGVTVHHGAGDADVEAFYGLHVRTRRRQGVPVQPRRLFHRLAHEVLRPGLGFVSVARHQGVPVAAAVFLAWNGTCIYKYGASDPDRLRFRPNHLVLWDTIRWACEHGCHTLDLGRTESSQQGLRDFKSSWGATEDALGYTTLGERVAGQRSPRVAAAIRPVIRRGPAWVCRALGEALYRFAA